MLVELRKLTQNIAITERESEKRRKEKSTTNLTNLAHRKACKKLRI